MSEIPVTHSITSVTQKIKKLLAAARNPEPARLPVSFALARSRLDYSKFCVNTDRRSKSNSRPIVRAQMLINSVVGIATSRRLRDDLRLRGACRNEMKGRAVPRPYAEQI